MEQREPKRARQACRNCRRKKTRCSGEKPICMLCTRLGQECIYEDGPLSERRTSTSFSFFGPSAPPADSSHEANLAARVALLESRLSLLDTNSLNTIFGGLPQPGADQSSVFNISGSADTHPSDEAIVLSKFDSIPEIGVLRAAADAYFLHCHNQPYSYFDESTFRQRLEDGELPSYLVYSFLALAIRFLDHPFLENKHEEAIERYTRLAWTQIFEKSFSDDHDVNIFTVQAANMLAVIDFVRGMHRLAWTKIGLSVRFAQSLRLNSEPEDSLSLTEREERRCTFWSVYLLDKLVSPGRHRPPALLDDICILRLPSSHDRSQDGPVVGGPTLAALNDIPESPPLHQADHYALTIFMASVLGRVVSFHFQHKMSSAHVPWDSRSEYAHIYGILLSFETYSDATDGSFAAVLDRDFGYNGIVDFSMAGHFCFSHALYHLCHCLLHHPFLLHQRLQLQKPRRVPPSFVREAVYRSRAHARHLTSVLQALQDRGCLAYASFYGYCAMVAGVVHRLHAANEENWGQSTSQDLYETCIRFLDSNSGPWGHYKRMAVALRNFQPSTSLAAELFSSSSSPVNISVDQSETLWNLVDYGWLSDSARPTTTTSKSPTSSDKSDNDDRVMEETPNTAHDFMNRFGPDFAIDEDNVEQLLFEAIHGRFNSIPELSAMAHT